MRSVPQQPFSVVLLSDMVEQTLKFFLSNLPAPDSNGTKISLIYLTNIYSIHTLESTVLEVVKSYLCSFKLGEKKSIVRMGRA